MDHKVVKLAFLFDAEQQVMETEKILEEMRQNVFVWLVVWFVLLTVLGILFAVYKLNHTGRRMT